jgi:D-alanyl-D-alanine carboxypeptidase
MADSITEKFPEMMNLVLKNTGSAPIHHCLLYLNDPTRDVCFHQAVGTVGPTGEPMTAAFRFRTGSITKLFTATLILQLLEEGKLELDAPLLEMVNPELRLALGDLLWHEGQNHTSAITVRHLLGHRSGLPDYFSADERFFAQVRQFPQQSWSWQAVLQKYHELGLHHKGAGKPGATFHYADTNYLLLALLVEELEAQAFHLTLRQKILLPLALENSHLEFFEAEKSPLNMAYPFYGPHSLQGIDTSFDWGGGGLVSTAEELDVFIRSLLKGEFFQRRETLDTMCLVAEPQKRTSQALGLQRKTFSGYHFWGHSSAYGALLFYAPERNLSIVVCLNQALALHKAEWLLHKVLNAYLD